MNEPYRIVVFQDGKHHKEEYQAIIGIKLENNNLTLHIRENGDFDEQFWRNLPALMQQSIERGIAIRKEKNNGN
jgi:hypothetical protein